MQDELRKQMEDAKKLVQDDRYFESIDPVASSLPEPEQAEGEASAYSLLDAGGARQVTIYEGVYSGYVIEFSINGEQYTVKTKQGVRGLNVPVKIIHDNNNWLFFTKKWDKIEIVSVWRKERESGV